MQAEKNVQTKEEEQAMRAETKTKRESCWGGMGVNTVSCRQAGCRVEQTNSERGESEGRPASSGRRFGRNVRVTTLRTMHRLQTLCTEQGNRRNNKMCLLRPSNVCFTAVKLTPPALAGLKVQKGGSPRPSKARAPNKREFKCRNR